MKTRQDSLRVADCWRFGSRVLFAGSIDWARYESINAAKRVTRGKQCVSGSKFSAYTNYK